MVGSVATGSCVTSTVVLGWHWVRAKRGRTDWRTQDTRYAIATVAASVVNLYLMVANVGLVPMPLTVPTAAEAMPAPAIATSAPSKAQPRTAAAAASSTPAPASSATLRPRRTALTTATPDKTPPPVATDDPAGVGSVVVRFTTGVDSFGTRRGPRR